MKIFTAIWNDRHVDTSAHLFSSLEKAIEWARSTAKDFCNYDELYQERNYEGWEFYVSYSSEKDCIYIIEVEVDEEVQKE